MIHTTNELKMAGNGTSGNAKGSWRIMSLDSHLGTCFRMRSRRGHSVLPTYLRPSTDAHEGMNCIMLEQRGEYVFEGSHENATNFKNRESYTSVAARKSERRWRKERRKKQAAMSAMIGTFLQQCNGQAKGESFSNRN